MGVNYHVIAHITLNNIQKLHTAMKLITSPVHFISFYSTFQRIHCFLLPWKLAKKLYVEMVDIMCLK